MRTRVRPDTDVIDVAAAVCQLDAGVVLPAGLVPDLDYVRVRGDDAPSPKSSMVPKACMELNVKDPKVNERGGSLDR